MIVATGNINQDYEVIDVVHAVVNRAPKKTGFFKPAALPVAEAYQAATTMLVDAAKKLQGDGVINIGYAHRVVSTPAGCGNDSRTHLEVTAWGTVIRTEPPRVVGGSLPR
jgi:uncharacterized protein YbjQ (UPF0145 family)